jgi:phage gp46-like protein
MNAVDFLCRQDVNSTFSLVWSYGSPLIDMSLQSLVIASLFTDRRIVASDPLPTFFDTTQQYQGGFWGDDYPSDGSTPGIQARPHGSLLWVLRNAKQIPETQSLCITYTNDALGWLVTETYATAVSTTANWVAEGYLSATVSISLPDGSIWKNQFRITS